MVLRLDPTDPYSTPTATSTTNSPSNPTRQYVALRRQELDEDFVKYLHYLMEMEREKLRGSGVAHPDREPSTWLMILEIVKKGVYHELAKPLKDDVSVGKGWGELGERGGWVGGGAINNDQAFLINHIKSDGALHHALRGGGRARLSGARARQAVGHGCFRSGLEGRKGGILCLLERRRGAVLGG